MKYSIVLLGLSASTSFANIIFPKVQPFCDSKALDFTGCLKGQICHTDNTCKSVKFTWPLSFSGHGSAGGDNKATPPKGTVQYSQDGKCGPNNGNLLCDPKSTAYTGTCCSSYGWCGDSAAHCGSGCVSGCTPVASSAIASGKEASSSAAVSKASSVVVSQASSVAISQASSAAPSKASDTASPASASGTAPRADGKCGPNNDNALCDPNGAYGGCCSSYGYCGTTDGHCLVDNGCVSGCKAAPSKPATTADTPAPPPSAAPSQSTTTGEPVIVATSASDSTPTGTATKDGTCGAKFDNTVCGDWAQGSCCSMYGYCGNTTSHCGDGCQSGPCLNGAAVQAPGPSPAPMNANPGSFKVVGDSGVPVMHAGLLPNGQVAFLDKVENYTQIKLADGQYAYSAEYNANSHKSVGLPYKTNSFCAGGAFLADGTFLALGGNAPLDFIDTTVGDGFDGIRYLKRSSSDASLDGQPWSEPGNKLASKRWYPTAQIMADGSLFVASGSLNGLDPTVPANNNPTYEILDKTGVSSGVNVPMEILVKNQPYYMYPHVFLVRDGSMFVFVSKSSELFNVKTNTTVRTFADLPGDYRTYPNTGGAVMLPLSSATNWDPDVVVCGGGAYQDVTSPTDPSCGRIQPLSANAKWEMDSMPEGRCMVEGTLLPDGTVIWLNGGNTGAQGFGLARDPTLEALIYDPAKPLGQRFTTGASSTIARLYHSVALLLLDGTLMVTGSNPVEQPVLEPTAKDPFVTEFRVEIYTPPYLSGDNANKRPTNVVLSSKSLQANGQTFDIGFDVPAGAKNVKVSLYHGGFVTHSVHMGHRMAFLDTTGWKAGATSQKVTATMPPNGNVAPPGPYVVYVVVDGVPAMGQFVQVS